MKRTIKPKRLLVRMSSKRIYLFLSLDACRKITNSWFSQSTTKDNSKIVNNLLTITLTQLPFAPDSCRMCNQFSNLKFYDLALEN